jgi:hypothetical protein
MPSTEGLEESNVIQFRPEHSGFELSHACGMKALRKWTGICAALSMVYEKELLKRARVQNLTDEAMPIRLHSSLLRNCWRASVDKPMMISVNWSSCSRRCKITGAQPEIVFLSRCIIYSSTLSISSRGTGCLVGSRKKTTSKAVHP